MKKIRNILLVLILGAITSCKKDYLEETPLSFLSSNNAFITVNDFDASVNNLYNLVRIEFYSRNENSPFDYLYGTDIVFDGEPSVLRHTGMVAAYAPTGAIASNHWNALYKIVSEANTIVSRLPASKLTDAQKTVFEAKARFFRAFAYRTLAYMYGGVPLVLEEVKEAKTDYTRASREEVLDQCITDLTFAATNLPAIAAVKDGEISNLAAQHLLAEVNIAAGKYQDAVTAATAVIDAPGMALMLNRFGSRSTVTPGDVYWDLFQKGNQNRKAAGNTEAIWVIQFETDVLGGGSVSTGTGGSFMLERHHGPMVRDAVTASNARPFKWPVGDYTGGRGIGWAISTRYFSDSIWQTDFNNDIRNANNNFVRVFTANNPASPLYNTPISTQAPPAGIKVPSRPFYAYQSKATTPFNHPTGVYANAATFGLKSTAGATYTDQYLFRLAETYLLRAEAYLQLNDFTNAAKDINTVRARSHANDVAPANVNINYILDERMRELGVEEKRRITLMRLGLIYDRVKKCNPYYTDVMPAYNLWPIPFSEIERNRGAVLEQNPGYN